MHSDARYGRRARRVPIPLPAPFSQFTASALEDIGTPLIEIRMSPSWIPYRFSVASSRLKERTWMPIGFPGPTQTRAVPLKKISGLASR